MIKKSDGTEIQNPIRVSARDNEIKIAQKVKEEQLMKETLILQKVNKAHREAFREKFPGQVEHCMRLTAERLQAVLTNKPNDMTDTATWTASAQDIHDLAHGLYYLSIINQHYPVESD